MIHLHCHGESDRLVKENSPAGVRVLGDLDRSEAFEADPMQRIEPVHAADPKFACDVAVVGKRRISPARSNH